MNFQDMIQTLNTFWGQKGCIVGQPYGVEVGAGTGNPNTFFRVLGPEPYNVAYIEPSRRPTDGRYGESPNRLQHYFQYQVILKPAPAFNQELFIESLIALGIDPTKHDIRFVEDNWESAPLGAWGLGWEIWCDGMEVAQYTYFQQMAGLAMEVPVLEITYGLERLAMYIQNKDDYKETLWNNTTTYGEIYKRHEYWQSTYNFETATIPSIQTLFNTYEAEVTEQLKKGSFWGAYDNLLKMSHTFNLLDARGVVSSADRVAKFAQMGKFSREVGKLYLADRESLGFPLKNSIPALTYTPKTVPFTVSEEKGTYQKNVAIVELGFEELPAEYAYIWKQEITHSWLKKELRKAKIGFRKAYIYMTPRRIVIKVVQPSAKGVTEEIVYGPPVKIAYDNKQQPTPALHAFLKKNNATLRSVIIQTRQGQDIVALKSKQTNSLEQVLQTILENIIALAPHTKWMMWNNTIPAFIRPLRWILAFHNAKPLHLSLMNVSSAKTTYLPRYEHPGKVLLSSAQEYLRFVQEYGIILSAIKREKRIKRAIAKHKSKAIGQFERMITKNAYLTENPHIATAKLEAKYTMLPRELATLILEKNQMYPNTEDTNNTLWYHVVANHRRVHKKIATGNQKVARSRLDDGVFFYQQDAQRNLASFGVDLEKVVFHPKAGSYVEKKHRIAEYYTSVAPSLGVKIDKETEVALTLIKNDKATALGNEFPSLEGVIGRAYAEREKLPKKTQQLLFEHYLPLENNGTLPATIEAKLLSLVDKFDTLLQIADVEGLPKGNHDPFEVRKTTYRLLTLLVDSHFIIDMHTVAEKFGHDELFTKDTPQKDPQQAIDAYILQRFKAKLEEEGITYWIANGVAYATRYVFSEKIAYANALEALFKGENMDPIFDTFKRVYNINKKNNDLELESYQEASRTWKLSTFEPEEETLFTFLETHRESGIAPQELAHLQQLLEIFFTKILVLHQDTSIRERRVGMLRELQRILDFNFSFASV